MGRNPKYPESQTVIDSFFAAVSESYNHPAADEAGRDGHKKQELLADEFSISRIKVRKILITTGDITYSQMAQIQEMIRNGMKIGAVAEKLGMAPSTINSLLPYTKGVYKLEEVSAAAERTQLYRSRLAAVQMLRSALDVGEDWSLPLWAAICLFQSYPFITSGRGSREGVKFKYSVSAPGGSGGRHYDGEEVEGYGNELWITTYNPADKNTGVDKKKSISRSTVERAFQTAVENEITGPKALGVPGAHSYLYALFLRFGVIHVPGVDEK